MSAVSDSGTLRRQGPEGKMFSKQAVCISTAAGAGMKSTNKDMADSMFFWGIGKTYKYGVAVMEVSWDGVQDKIKVRIDKKTSALAAEIKKKHGHVKPSFKTKIFFNIMRIAQKKGMNKADAGYWREKGLDRRKTSLEAKVIYLSHIY